MTAQDMVTPPTEVPYESNEVKADTAALPSYMQPAKSPGTYPDFKSRPLLEGVKRTLAMPSMFSIGNYPGNMAPRTAYAPGAVSFRVWDGGALNISGQSSSLPGLMNIEQGNLSFSQQIGNLTFTAFARASHYGYFSGMQTTWGFGGSLNYRMNPHWSLTVFGSYTTGGHPLTPAMAGWMEAPRFGGYLTYDIDEHWGINIGGQATRSLVTNRWEAQPIVMPYYKIDGKYPIGVDVGGILYNVLKNASEQSNGHYRSNPTIGPPVGGPPPVAPRPDKH